MLSDTGNDRTFFQTVIDTELQQLVRLRHFRTFQHGPDTDIQLHEVIELDILTDGFRLVVGFLVCFLRIQQLLYLRFDHAVFNLLEQQFRFAQLMTGFQQVSRSQAVPA